MDSGIKSVKETVIITAEAKAREEAIIVFAFLLLRKIKTLPTKVENPAILVSKKENNVEFIGSPVHYMKKVMLKSLSY